MRSSWLVALLLTAIAIVAVSQAISADAATILPCNSSLVWLNITANNGNDIRLMNCDIPKLRIALTGSNVSLLLIDVRISGVSIGPPPVWSGTSSTSQVHSVRLVIEDSDIVAVDAWPHSAAIVSWSQAVSNLSIGIYNSRLSGGSSGAIDIRSQTSANVHVQIEGSALNASCVGGTMPYNTPSVVALVATDGAVNTSLSCLQSSLVVVLDNGTTGWGHHVGFASVVELGMVWGASIALAESVLQTEAPTPPSSWWAASYNTTTAAACLRSGGFLNGSTVVLDGVVCQGPAMAHVVAMTPGASLVDVLLQFTATAWTLGGLGACIALLPVFHYGSMMCALSNGTVASVTIYMEAVRGQWIAANESSSSGNWTTRRVAVAAAVGGHPPTLAVLVHGASSGLNDANITVRCSTLLMDLGPVGSRPAIVAGGTSNHCTVLPEVMVSFVAIPHHSQATTVAMAQSRWLATAAGNASSGGGSGGGVASWRFSAFSIASVVHNVTVSVRRAKVQLPRLGTMLNASTVLHAPYNDSASHTIVSCVYVVHQQDSGDGSMTLQRVVGNEALGSDLPMPPAANVSVGSAAEMCTDDSSRCFPSASQPISATQSAESRSRTLSSSSESISLSRSPSRRSSSATHSVTPFANVSAEAVGLPLLASQLLTTSTSLTVVLYGTQFNGPLLHTAMCSSIRFAPLYHEGAAGGTNATVLVPGSTSQLALRVGRYVEQTAALGPLPTAGDASEEQGHAAQLVVPGNGSLFRNVDTEDLALWFSIEPLCTARADLTLYFLLTVDRLPPFQLALPTDAEIVQDAALAASVVGLSPWIAAEVARVTTPLTVLACTVSPATAPLRHYQSLVRWSITDGIDDGGTLGYYVGTLAINGSVWLGCLLLHVCLALVYRCASGTTLLKGCIEARFPSLLIVPVLALLQPTVMASVVLATEGKMEDTLWIGVAGCVVCTFICLSFTTRHVCAFTCIYDPDAYRPHRSLVGRCLLGTGAWRDHPEERVLQYAKRHGLWFQAYRGGWHWVFVLELWTCVFLGVMEGIKLGEASCVPLIWAVGIVMLGRALFFLVAHPFDAVWLNAAASAIAAMEACLCASLVAHEWLDVLDAEARGTANDVAEWTLVVCVYTVAGCAAISILCALWRAWEPAMSDSGATATSDPIVLSHLHGLSHDTAQVLKLVERINDDIETQRDAYDPMLRKAFVNAHLELLLPGCEDEAEVALMALMTEFDVMALEGGKRNLFTPAMEELFVRLASKHSEALEDAGKRANMAAVEPDGHSVPRTMRQPPALLLATASDDDDDDEFSPASLGDVEMLVIEHHQQPTQSAPVSVEERRRFLDDVLQDQPR